MIFIILGLLLIPGPLFTILNIGNLLLNREHTGKFEAMAFSVGILYSLMLYGIWNPRSWEESVILSDDMASLHEPFARAYLPAILFLMAVGLLSYAYLKTKKDKGAPLAVVLSMSGVYIGILVNLAAMIQLFGSVNADMPFGNCMPGDVLLMLLLPFNYLLLAVNLLIRVVKGQSRRIKERKELLGYDGEGHVRKDA